MSIQVFRKTEAGRSELKLRRAGLAVATRSVLIVVNGVDDVRALAAKGLSDVQSHLDALAALGLIEAVRVAAPAPVEPVELKAQPPAAPRVDPAPTGARPAPDQALESERLSRLQRQIMQTLQPHFGPDTTQVAQAALATRSLGEFRRALDAIESKLAIYMGRKQAARELQHLRGSI